MTYDRHLGCMIPHEIDASTDGSRLTCSCCSLSMRWQFRQYACDVEAGLRMALKLSWSMFKSRQVERKKE